MTATASSDEGWQSDQGSGQSAVRQRLSATVSRVYGVTSSATPRALFACLLLRVRELVLAQIDGALKQLNTSNTRYQVLAILCREGGGLPLGALAARVFVQPSTMTSTIDRLLREGMIERRADPSDRRGILAVVTPAGQDLYRQAREALAATEFGLADIDIDTIHALVEGLDKVAALMTGTASRGDAKTLDRIHGRSDVRQRLGATISRVYGAESSASPRALFACMLLRVRDLVLAEIDHALKHMKTSNTRYQVLAILCRAPGGLHLGELAARAFVQPSTMTSTIDRLVRDGMIERRADPADRRGILAVATPEGQAVYERSRDALAATEFGLSELDLGAIDRLVDGLDRVAAALESQVSAVA